MFKTATQNHSDFYQIFSTHQQQSMRIKPYSKNLVGPQHALNPSSLIWKNDKKKKMKNNIEIILKKITFPTGIRWGLSFNVTSQP